jgi:hypothetical protein
MAFGITEPAAATTFLVFAGLLALIGTSVLPALIIISTCHDFSSFVDVVIPPTRRQTPSFLGSFLFYPKP